MIELIIGMAILGILLGVAVPAFSAYLQNARLRAAAESFLAGVQKARGDAVQRNQLIQLIMTDDTPTAGNASSLTASTTGKNWAVRAYNSGTGTYTEFVEGKTSSEGSAAAVVVTSTAATITFNGLGASTGGSASVAFTNPVGGSCAPGGPMRCLNITVTPGGQSRMCDPAVTAAGDTRAC
jgi:type IV fimbrial biogenesis protein FimT